MTGGQWVFAVTTAAGVLATPVYARIVRRAHGRPAAVKAAAAHTLCLAAYVTVTVWLGTTLVPQLAAAAASAAVWALTHRWMPLPAMRGDDRQ